MTVLELLSDPARWAQGAFARDAYGRACASYNPQATSWCLAGAVRHVLGRDGWIYDTALSSLRARIAPGDNISLFNDSHSHKDVLDIVRKAGI